MEEGFSKLEEKLVLVNSTFIPNRITRNVYKLNLASQSCLLPSFAFFLLARVPPSFPRNESSFFLEDGDFGVGDLGEDGDFCGEDAIDSRCLQTSKSVNKASFPSD